MNTIKILIVNDHALFRMGLTSILQTRGEFEVVGDAADGATAIRKACTLKPDVIIMDLMMPRTDGAETTALIRKEWPGARILLLTTFSTSDGISRALREGALGATLKNTNVEELYAAIRSVASGKRYLSPEVRQIMTDDPPLPALSQRQQQILASMARGLTSADIAKELNISFDMVRGHTKALLLKLGAGNRTEAVAIALRKQIIKSQP